jgi:hypothetical protein
MVSASSTDAIGPVDIFLRYAHEDEITPELD